MIGGMIRATSLVAMVLMGAAAAQTADQIREKADTVRPAIQVPEMPAGSDPMKRQPNSAAGTPAARSRPEAAPDHADANCRVRRADTDTGFVVVCEHAD